MRVWSWDDPEYSVAGQPPLPRIRENLAERPAFILSCCRLRLDPSRMHDTTCSLLPEFTAHNNLLNEEYLCTDSEKGAGQSGKRTVTTSN